jgi:hypothetical protein
MRERRNIRMNITSWGTKIENSISPIEPINFETKTIEELKEYKY